MRVRYNIGTSSIDIVGNYWPYGEYVKLQPGQYGRFIVFTDPQSRWKIRIEEGTEGYEHDISEEEIEDYGYDKNTLERVQFYDLFVLKPNGELFTGFISDFDDSVPEGEFNDLLHEVMGWRWSRSNTKVRGTVEDRPGNVVAHIIKVMAPGRGLFPGT
jgi:hypothetical protein